MSWSNLCLYGGYFRRSVLNGCFGPRSIAWSVLPLVWQWSGLMPDLLSNIPISQRLLCLRNDFDSSERSRLIEGVYLIVFATTVQGTPLAGFQNPCCCRRGMFDAPWEHGKLLQYFAIMELADCVILWRGLWSTFKDRENSMRHFANICYSPVQIWKNLKNALVFKGLI